MINFNHIGFDYGSTISLIRELWINNFSNDLFDFENINFNYMFDKYFKIFYFSTIFFLCEFTYSLNSYLSMISFE